MPEFNIPYGFNTLTADQLDKRFGPYPSKEAAMNATIGRRVPGLRLGVISGGKLIVYVVQSDVDSILEEGTTNPSFTVGRNLYLDQQGRINLGTDPSGTFISENGGINGFEASLLLDNSEVGITGDVVNMVDTAGARYFTLSPYQASINSHQLLIEAKTNILGDFQVSGQALLQQLATSNVTLENRHKVKLENDAQTSIEIGNATSYLAIDGASNTILLRAPQSDGSIVYANGMPDDVTDNTLPTVEYIRETMLKDVSLSEVTPDMLMITPSSSHIKVPSVNELGWQEEGLVVSDHYSIYESNPLSNSLVRRNLGRISAAKAVNGNEVTILSQVNDLIDEKAFEVDNKGEISMSGSHQAAIIKSGDSSIATTSGVNRRRNLIIGSYKAHTTGESHTSLIIASQNSTIDSAHTSGIFAAIQGSIGKNRMNSAVIASNNAIIEDWNSTTSFKWNSAIIAARLGVIQSSNSYTLVTGKANTSNGSAQFVCGQNNLIEASRSVDDPLKKAFIIGNGTGNNAGGIGIGQPPAIRSNAFHVTQGGKAWVQNEFEVENPEGGLVLTDRVTDKKYRLTIANGIIETTEIN